MLEAAKYLELGQRTITLNTFRAVMNKLDQIIFFVSDLLSQSPDLNPTENLWKDFRSDVHPV